MPDENPDARAFRRDVEGGRFQTNVDRGNWRSIDAAWPNPIISVTAAPRDGAPGEFTFRFTVDGYPVTAPTAAPWDARVNALLPRDLWPVGVAGSRVALAFNPDWNASAIYIPCDRVAIQGHDGWRDQHKAYLWDQTKSIVDYLKVIHELLQSPGYSGVRRAA